MFCSWQTSKAADEDVCAPRPPYSSVGLQRSLSPDPRRAEHLKCWSPHLQCGSEPANSSAPDSPPCWTFGTQAYAVTHALSCTGFVPLTQGCLGSGCFLISLIPVPRARLISWRAWVAHKLQLGEGAEDRVRLSHSALWLEHSEVGTGERDWVASSGSCKTSPHFPLPEGWPSDVWTRLGLLSEPPPLHAAPPTPRIPGSWGSATLHWGLSVPQRLRPVSPHARKRGARHRRKHGGGGPRRRRERRGGSGSGAPLPRPAPAGAARPLRPLAAMCAGRSGAAGQREPQSAPARRPVGMLRYSSGLTVTATTPRRPSGDGGRARRKVREGGRGHGGRRRGGPAGGVVGRSGGLTRALAPLLP